MDPGFSITGLWPTLTGDGRIHYMAEPVIYTDKNGVQYQIPIGCMSDGASTPSAIWGIIPPFGKYWKDAYLHDAAYKNRLLVLQSDGTWVTARLTKDVCDLLLLESMLLSGVNEFEAKVIYEGVRLGGQSSFDADRKANP